MKTLFSFLFSFFTFKCIVYFPRWGCVYIKVSVFFLNVRISTLFLMVWWLWPWLLIYILFPEVWFRSLLLCVCAISVARSSVSLSCLVVMPLVSFDIVLQSWIVYPWCIYFVQWQWTFVFNGSAFDALYIFFWFISIQLRFLSMMTMFYLALLVLPVLAYSKYDSIRGHLKW